MGNSYGQIVILGISELSFSSLEAVADMKNAYVTEFNHLLPRKIPATKKCVLSRELRDLVTGAPVPINCSKSFRGRKKKSLNIRIMSFASSSSRRIWNVSISALYTSVK